MLLVLILLACKDGADDSAPVDADGDGYTADEDCDDGDETVFPGAEEICDNLDNDCDGAADNNATDARSYYADVDLDGHGDVNAAQLACVAPAGTVTSADDCDDANAAAYPGATEVCDDADNDCDGLIDDDAVDVQTYYQDTDDDGFGDPRAPIDACAALSGIVDDSTDCDDGRASVYPGAPEQCDDLDNDCDEDTDEGVLGTGPDCPVPACLDLAGLGHPDGVYYIDPDGDFTATLAYCDLSADGGGWTLLSWTGDSAISPIGTPYPGLAVCESLDCLRGSSATREQLEALIQRSSDVAIGHSTAAIASFQPLLDYEYAGLYAYGSLAGLTLAPSGDAQVCDATGLATGTFRALVGPTTYDGVAVYLAQSFRYSTGVTYNNYDEAAAYIWNIGAPNNFCDGSGSPPGSWLGNWSATEHEFGPILANTLGARSVWAR